jgi:hypothetical protein
MVGFILDRTDRYWDILNGIGGPLLGDCQDNEE